MATCSEPATPAAEKRRVLIIDDDLGPRESLRMLLKETYEVRCEDRVAKGLQALREFNPDLVIMDIRMPEMDGIEGLKKIREVDKTVSVVMLTGFGSLETARSAIRLGANDYLKKPFDTDELMKVAAEYVQRTEYMRRKQEMERDLQNLTESLLTELEEKRTMANLGQASRELAHDLGSPLTVVMNSVEMLSEQLHSLSPSGSETARSTLGFDYLEEIEQGVQRCVDLMNIWRGLERNDQLELVKTELSGFLDKVVREAEALARQHSCELTVDISGLKGISVNADTLQLHRTLINLLGNAFDAVPEGAGRVWLEGFSENDRVHLRIRDNGPGIPPELKDKIFEPYFTTKAEGKGTGLGLFISKKIMAHHGGVLKLDDSVSEGGGFLISLPCFEDVVEGEGA